MKTYTPEQKNAALELVKAGTPVNTVAEMTGISNVTIYKTIRDKCPEIIGNIPRKPRAPRTKCGKSDPQKQIAITLYVGGYTYKKISEITHVRFSIIVGWIREYRETHPEFVPPKEKERRERDLKICELYKSGMHQVEIARRYKMANSTVNHICAKYGVSCAGKTARRIAGEIPSELLQPVLDWLTKHAAVDAAEKIRQIAENMSA